jgi:ATP-dependent Clp protease ATP-binding subunit ClpA
MKNLFCFLKVRLHFRPEFLNRLDDIVFFQLLTVKQISSIVHLQLQSLEERSKEQDITLSLTDKAIQSTLKKSYNPGKIKIYFYLFYSYFFC